MKRILTLMAALLLALSMLPGAAAAADDPGGVGGPVILMGLDSEWDPSDATHGTRAEHAAMAQSLLDAVTNDGEGILVLGGDGSGNIGTYWNNVGTDIGEDVTFVKGATEIAAADFDGYAIIGVATTYWIVFGGLTPEENDALAGRSSDIANFVNEGGGLLGKTQAGLPNPFGYMGPFGTFEVAPDDYVEVVVTPAGLDLGLTQEGMTGWCCWHEVFTEFPDFLQVLVTHNSGGVNQGEAAALGGIDVVIPTEISLAPGSAALDVGETHTVTATVLEDQEPLEDAPISDRRGRDRTTLELTSPPTRPSGQSAHPRGHLSSVTVPSVVQPAGPFQADDDHGPAPRGPRSLTAGSGPRTTPDPTCADRPSLTGPDDDSRSVTRERSCRLPGQGVTICSSDNGLSGRSPSARRLLQG